MMRWWLRAGGILAILAGAVWTLQGLDLLGRSTMSGKTELAWAGSGALLFGAGLLFWSMRRRG